MKRFEVIGLDKDNNKQTLYYNSNKYGNKKLDAEVLCEQYGYKLVSVKFLKYI